MDVESFEEYYNRWPSHLKSIPVDVVRDWVYRHWRDFDEHWKAMRPHKWRFELATLTNRQVLAVDHIGDWIEELDVEGIEYVSGAPRSQSSLAQYMLNHGTFPVPPIVARDATGVVHPRGHGGLMKTPLQLIEGHCRLACIRGMIHAGHPRLLATHQIWLVTIPRDFQP